MSQTGKPNRNAQRSMRLIKEAFLRLLMEEPYDKITVTQVVGAADLNRSTFYAHFRDVDDLACKVSDELAEQLVHAIAPMLKGEFYKDPLPLLDKIGGFIAERRQLFSRLAATSGPSSFFGLLMEKARAQIRDGFAERAPELVTEAMVVCDFLTAGMIWAYRSWIVGDFGDVDISEISENLARLVKAASAAWGPDCEGGIGVPNR